MTGKDLLRSPSLPLKLAKKSITWLTSTKTLATPRRLFLRIIRYSLFTQSSIIVSYAHPERTKVFDLINTIHNETDMLLGYDEAYQIFMLVTRTKKIEGDLAEVGVYRGGSAKLICEAKGNKRLHLFDTFQGIPRVEDIDHGFSQGQFSAGLDDVRGYLRLYENVYFYRGIFPDTSAPVRERKFSFVHLDVDTYQSTLNCLVFFYPRMNVGGVILSHDYMNAAGVGKAWDEFFSKKREPIIEIASSQCMIMKS